MNDQQKAALEALRATIDFAREKVKIGTKSYDCLIEDMTADEIDVAGGVAESGGFKVTIPIPDFTKAPAQNTPIQARNQSLQILTVENRNGVSYLITAGDPASET